MQKPIIFARKHTEEGAVRLYGLNVFRQSRRHAESTLRRALKETPPLPRLVFTPNLEMLTGAKRDPEIRFLLQKADLLLPDGIGVRLLSGFRVSERIAGIEIGEFLLSLAAKEGWRVYFLGGKDGTAEEAARRLIARFRGLTVVGTHHGYFDADAEQAIVKEITAHKTDLLLVCTGFPRQEGFLVRNRSALRGVRIALGLGGSLDVWAGNVRRAPVWMQRCGLEWLYRVSREPHRLPRLLSSLRALMLRPR